MDNKCLVQVVDNGLADSTTWLRVWEEVSAIVHICVFNGYVGKSTGLGECFLFLGLWVGSICAFLLTDMQALTAI